MISTFRFTDNVQLNMSSYVEVNRYGIAVFIKNGGGGKKVLEIRVIYPIFSTSRQVSMSTWTQACNLLIPNQRARSCQLLMSTWTQACNISMPNQWARSRQLSMSTRTQACNLSLPNQWVRFVSYQCQHGYKLVIYKCQTKGMISSAINIKTDTIYQCQANGHNLVSYQCQHWHKLVIYQCQTTQHNLSLYVSMRTKLLLS